MPTWSSLTLAATGLAGGAALWLCLVRKRPTGLLNPPTDATAADRVFEIQLRAADRAFEIQLRTERHNRAIDLCCALAPTHAAELGHMRVSSTAPPDAQLFVMCAALDRLVERAPELLAHSPDLECHGLSAPIAHPSVASLDAAFDRMWSAASSHLDAHDPTRASLLRSHRDFVYGS